MGLMKNNMGLNPCMVIGITFASMPPEFSIMVRGDKYPKCPLQTPLSTTIKGVPHTCLI
jgi:hypothetical protein